MNPKPPRLQPAIATQANLPPSNPEGHPPGFGMKIYEITKKQTKKLIVDALNSVCCNTNAGLLPAVKI